MKLKKRSKEKSQAVRLATKIKNKYSTLDERNEERKKKGGYSYGSTIENLRLMREGSVETVSTQTAGPSDANPRAADDLSSLVRDISSVVPVSKIDKTATAELDPTGVYKKAELDPTGVYKKAAHQVGQNFLESTRLDDENAMEADLREDTRLVEEVERIRDRENSDCDLRETMRNKAGPTDLRHTNLNRDTDARELLQHKAGPADLRYSKLLPEKDLRDFIKSKPKPKDGPGMSALMALSAYESTSSEEERFQSPVNDNGTPKRQKPLAPTDLRRRLDGEAASKVPNQRKHPT